MFSNSKFRDFMNIIPFLCSAIVFSNNFSSIFKDQWSTGQDRGYRN